MTTTRKPARYTRNILKVYRSANETEYQQGMDWYSSANNLSHVIGRGDVWKGAGLIAAFSPLTPWWRNVELAIDSAFTGKARTDTLGNSSRIAQRILDGEHPLDVIKGMKTRAFCQNIANNGDTDNITVDVHAFSIAHYKRIPSSKIVMGKGLYNEIAESYRRAAISQDISPQRMQAITWVVWRNKWNS